MLLAVMDDVHMTTIGIVSPGAMGSGLARAYVAGGCRVVATVAGRSDRSRRLAEAGPFELLPDLDAVVRSALIVLSVVPPAEAATVAASVAQAAARTGSRPLVVDANAISPDSVERVRALLAAEGLSLVDGSISGGPPTPESGVPTRLYLSGARAQEVADLPSPGLDARVLGAEPGTASALKMCTASYYKGTTALLAHAVLTAERHGVVEELLDDLSESFPHLGDRAARSLAMAVTKSARFVGEMREIAATQGAAGLPPDLFEALALVYDELSRRPLAQTAPEDLPTDLTVAGFLERVHQPGQPPP